jgi:hypothetical protein
VGTHCQKPPIKGCEALFSDQLETIIVSSYGRRILPGQTGPIFFNFIERFALNMVNTKGQ